MRLGWKKLTVVFCALGVVALLGRVIEAGGQGPMPPPLKWQSPKGGPMDLKMTDPMLTGVFDLHAHLDPDISGGGQSVRAIDAIDNARMMKAAGARGFVYKTHMDVGSAGSAYLAAKEVPGVEVYARYAMNLTTGGLNPASVMEFVMIKGNLGRIIEFPTRDSRPPAKENRPWVLPWVDLFPNFPKATPISANGQLTNDSKAIISLIAKLNKETPSRRLVVATGHATPEEHVAIALEARRQGVEVFLTHPGDNVTTDMLKKVTAAGAYVELMTDFYQDGGDGKENIAGAIARFKAVGADHLVMGTDCGQVDNPYPTDCIASSAKAMRAGGITDAEMTKAFKVNTPRMMGLPAR